MLRLDSSDRPPRKAWYRSYKVRCVWIATSWPLGAAVWYAVTGATVPTELVALCMAPWMALGGGETWHDSIKLKRGE